MKKVLLALCLTMLLAAKSLTGFTTTGAGTIPQGSSFPWQVTWSSDYDGSTGNLHVLAKQGAVEKIRCDSFSWGGVNEDGSITAWGYGSFMGAGSRQIMLNVAPGVASATIAVYVPFFPHQIFVYPVTVTSGSLTVY